MAIAGRVAIVPKGEWSENVTYDKLDLVTRNGNAYIAYQSSTGVEPVNGETWMLILESVSTDDVNQLKEDVEAILNGTTSVGNALQLGGKDASEYALGTNGVANSASALVGDYLSGSIKEVANKLLPTLKKSNIVIGLGAGTITNLGKYLEEFHFANKV